VHILAGPARRNALLCRAWPRPPAPGAAIRWVRAGFKGTLGSTSVYGSGLLIDKIGYHVKLGLARKNWLTASAVFEAFSGVPPNKPACNSSSCCERWS
jgi:hypothetical protein